MAAPFSGQNRHVREQLFPSCSPIFPDCFKYADVFSHCFRLEQLSAKIRNPHREPMKKARISMNRLVSIVDKLTVVRARDMSKYGIHRQTLKRAVNRGLLTKIDRGLYTRRELSPDFERQVLLACERVPHGVVCSNPRSGSTAFFRQLWSDLDGHRPQSEKAGRQQSAIALRPVFRQCFTQGVVNKRELMAYPFASTAWPKRLPTALSTDWHAPCDSSAARRYRSRKM